MVKLLVRASRMSSPLLKIQGIQSVACMARLPAMRVKMMTASAFMEMSVLCSVTLHRVGKVEMIS